MSAPLKPWESLQREVDKALGISGSRKNAVTEALETLKKATQTISNADILESKRIIESGLPDLLAVVRDQIAFAGKDKTLQLLVDFKPAKLFLDSCVQNILGDAVKLPTTEIARIQAEFSSIFKQHKNFEGLSRIAQDITEGIRKAAGITAAFSSSLDFGNFDRFVSERFRIREREINAALADPDVQQRLGRKGSTKWGRMMGHPVGFVLKVLFFVRIRRAFRAWISQLLARARNWVERVRAVCARAVLVSRLRFFGRPSLLQNAIPIPLDHHPSIQPNAPAFC